VDEARARPTKPPGLWRGRGSARADASFDRTRRLAARRCPTNGIDGYLVSAGSRPTRRVARRCVSAVIRCRSSCPSWPSCHRG